MAYFLKFLSNFIIENKLNSYSRPMTSPALAVSELPIAIEEHESSTAADNEGNYYFG